MNHLSYLMDNPTKKRCWESDVSGSPTSSSSSSSWAQFLMLESPTPDTRIKLTPFALSKAIQGIAGTIAKLTILRSGSVLVECATPNQSKNLLKCTLLANTPITIYPHKTLNSCKAILRDRQRLFADMTELDLCSELHSQSVTHVKRFTIRKDGDTIATNTYLLTFSLSTPPTKIKAGFISLPIEAYIPNPLRCYKCQKYGHGTSSCRGSIKCPHCGDDSHVSEDCTATSKHCINCKGAHSASSKDCPVWKTEREVNKIKYTQNISFREAKKLVSGLQGPTPGTSYSSAVKSTVIQKSVSCQSMYTWIDSAHPELYTERPSVSVNHSLTTVSIACQTSPPSTPLASRSSSPSSSASHSQLLPATQILYTRPKPKSQSKSHSKQKQYSKSDRVPKSQRDPVKLSSRFDVLDDDDTMDVSYDHPKSRSISPRGKRGGRSPIGPPK